MSDFTPQLHDKLAEQVVIGSMLASSKAAEDGLKRLTGSDFFDPRHSLIFETLAALYDERHPTDVSAVLARLISQNTVGKVSNGTYLSDVYAAGGAGGLASQLDYYAEHVAELAMRRGYMDLGIRLQDRAKSLSAVEVGSWVRDELARVEVGTGVASEHPGYTASTVGVDLPPPRWVLRGLLQREERLILTGGEGLGKSTFTRQLGVAAASGRQAFDDRPTSDAGVKVMVVDAENPPSLARGWWDSLIRAVGKSGYPVPEDGLRIFFEPGGLDLGSRAGSGWLLRQVEKHAPDLIIIGPSYKLHVGNPNDERDARRVSDVLDKARLLNGSALIMESHSPHEDARGQRGVRPLGSTLWRRWPEFGLGLQPCDRKAEPGASMFRLCDLVAWRGPRADRAWPKKLRAGDPNHSPWPWVDDEEKRWWSR